MSSIGTFESEHPCARRGGAARAMSTFAALAALFAAFLLTHAARAAPDNAGARELPLPPLPQVPANELGEPSREAVARVDELLERLSAAADNQRESARREILEAELSWIPAVASRLDHIAEDADRGAMKDTLLQIRRTTREALKRAASNGESVDTPDYLEMIASHPRPQSKAWTDLVRVLGLSRTCVAQGSVPAVRTLIQVYVRFDFLRIDTQLQLEKLGERAVAALIETRRFPAEKIQAWARRQLDALGKGIPSEAVQTEDYQVLADVLRAYGKARDPDAARIVISFANSERAQVREAARQAVAMLGETANWQLKDTYENVVGRRPKRDWNWERTARELFWEFDRLRMAVVYDLFERGLAAWKRRDFPAMRRAYDKVLVRQPLFEHRAEMAAGYFDYARAAKDDELDQAIVGLYRAQRVSTDEKEQRRISSLLLTLEADRLARDKLVDQSLLRRAVDLDPDNRRAAERLEQLRAGRRDPSSETSRYVIAGAIAFFALVAIGVIAWVRPRASPPTAPDTAAAPGSGQTNPKHLDGPG